MAVSHGEQRKKSTKCTVKAQKTNKKVTKVEKWEADPNAAPSVGFLGCCSAPEYKENQKERTRMKSSILEENIFRKTLDTTNK